MRTATTFKLGLRNQKPGKKLEICRGIREALSKLPPEEREAVAWPVLEEKCAGLEQVLRDIMELRSELRAAFLRRTEVLREMCRAAERSAGLYAIKVNFDPAKVAGSGVALQRARRPVGRPAAPGQLRAARGLYEGSVVLRWKRPVRRCVFTVEATTDPHGRTGWKQLTMCSAEKCLLQGLAAGKLHWFRVAAINAHGQSPWSGVATLRPG